MSADGDVDDSRTSVRTYVPAYQKTEWERHADRLDMSLSEFVRSMVQSGRHGFTGETDDATGTTTADPATPGTDADELEDRVVDALDRDGCLGWDELVAAVTGDVEATLERTLQDSEYVQHSPRRGGYVLAEEP